MIGHPKKAPSYLGHFWFKRETNEGWVYKWARIKKEMIKAIICSLHQGRRIEIMSKLKFKKIKFLLNLNLLFKLVITICI